MVKSPKNERIGQFSTPNLKPSFRPGGKAKAPTNPVSRNKNVPQSARTYGG